MPPRNATPVPTEAELAILQVLWRKGPSPVRAVWKELGQATGYTTALKVLQVMLEKKLVLRDETAMTHVYQAAVAEADTQQRLVNGLVERAFAGSTSKLLLHALATKAIPASELEEIRSLIAEKRKESK